jgi:tRNA 2-thiouridine synthesizing protein D
MLFALIVHGGPSGAASSLAALRFADALLAGGHTIARVFFHGDGAAHGNAMLITPPSETDIPARWQVLSQQHGVELLACVGSATRRGVVDQREATRHDLSGASLREGFELAGLGQLVDAALRCDRVISFGG